MLALLRNHFRSVLAILFYQNCKLCARTNCKLCTWSIHCIRPVLIICKGRPACLPVFYLHKITDSAKNTCFHRCANNILPTLQIPKLQDFCFFSKLYLEKLQNASLRLFCYTVFLNKLRNIFGVCSKTSDYGQDSLLSCSCSNCLCWF